VCTACPAGASIARKREKSVASKAKDGDTTRERGRKA
jgi:hypothetical protein